MSREKALVVLSGGQDSTTCLFWAKREGFEVHAVTFDYGQRHIKELDAAFAVSERAGVASHELISLPKGVLKGTSPLVNPDEEVAQYLDSASLPGGLEKTFVPMRNQMFLTIAANRAYCLGARMMVTGVCEEDYGGYPDCRRDFIDKVEEASIAGTFTGQDGAPDGLFILTPLMRLSKAQSVSLALALPGCYEALAFSHTAYDGEFPPTGKDHATLLREKGFAEAGVPDPLVLRAYIEGVMSLPLAPNYDGALIAPYLRRIADAMGG